MRRTRFDWGRASTSALVGALAATALAGCYVPTETRGASAALEIYHRQSRKEGARRVAGRGAPGAAPSGTVVADLAANPLTADAAIALAKANSPRLVELAARTAVFDAAVEAAGQRNNPNLRATNVRVARAIDTGEDLRVVPRIRYSPERPGEIGAREAEARAASRAARAEERAEETAIEAEVRWYFDDIVLLDAEIEAYEQMASTRRKLAGLAQEQLDHALAKAVDVSLAQLAAVEAEVQVSERRSRRALLAAALADRLGLGAPGREKLELRGDPTTWPPPPLASEETLVETALSRSPRVSGAAAKIDETTARLDREKTRRWPWLEFLEVGYEFERSTTNVPLWTVGAGIELPIFNANRGSVHQAEAAKAEARYHLASAVDAIEREVRARLREATAAAALVTEFRRVALPVLESATTETARGLESGTLDTTRALVIDERRARVEVEMLRLMRHYRVAVDHLRRAVGGPLPPASNATTEPDDKTKKGTTK